MVEVYSDTNWFPWHERFARDQKEIDAFRKQYHIPPSGERLIAVQTRILDFVPKYPAISLLLESYLRKSWARFAIPENYYVQRFTTSHIAPSLGPPEKQDADIKKIENLLKEKTKRVDLDLTKDDREKEKEEEEDENEELIDEGKIIAKMLRNGVKETNEMIDFVIARMYQFVQA